MLSAYVTHFDSHQSTITPTQPPTNSNTNHTYYDVDPSFHQKPMMATKKPKTSVPSRLPSRIPLCAALPPEVWINIFRYHTDLTHLWLTCRAVSASLRACAEYAFAEYFLASVRIDWQLEKYNLGGKSKRPEVPVVFARLGTYDVDKAGTKTKSEGKDIAIFHDPRPKSEVTGIPGQGKKAQQEYTRITSRWQENILTYKPELPNYTINIHGIVNDTPLPNLSLDFEKREVKFEWKQALHYFYREHARLLHQKINFHRTTANTLRQTTKKLAKGQHLTPSDYPLSWAAAEIEVRKEIRRARLREHYTGDEQMVWAIDSLAHFENYGAAAGGTKAVKVNPEIPGAGLGEKWFGRVNLVQELFLDEWSCMHRIDTKVEQLRSSDVV